MTTYRTRSRDYFGLDTDEHGQPIPDIDGVLAAAIHPWSVSLHAGVRNGDLDSLAAYSQIAEGDIDLDGAWAIQVFCSACDLVYQAGDGDPIQAGVCAAEAEDILSVDDGQSFLHLEERRALLDAVVNSVEGTVFRHPASSGLRLPAAS